MHNHNCIFPRVAHLLLCVACLVTWQLTLFVHTGQPCKACNNPENFGMKHPDSPVELAAGHLDPRTQFGGFMREIHLYDSEDEDTYVRYALSQWQVLICFVASVLIVHVSLTVERCRG